MELKNQFFKKYGFAFNKIIAILTWSDSLLWGGYYMLNAVIAIYLSEQLEVDNPIQVIAFGYAIYNISRSLFQIPFGMYFDRLSGYFDESIGIFLSCVIGAFGTLLYLIVDSPFHIYLIQFIFGFATALNVPAWRKTFAKFLDKRYEGIEYSIYDVIFNISIAILTALGGFIVEKMGGFKILIIFAGGLMLFGGVATLFLTKIGSIIKK